MSNNNPHKDAFCEWREVTNKNPVATAIYDALISECDVHPLEETPPAIVPAPFRQPIPADDDRPIDDC
jgi:hypothetical protein